MSAGDRAVLTVDEADDFAIWLTSDEPDPVETDATPLPAGVSHLLAADDALIPGRWGVHTTLCGQPIRSPNATAVEHECTDTSCDCVRYCPDCAREAARWSAESVEQVDRAPEVR